MHRIVFLHFLCSLGIFFGLWPSTPKSIREIEKTWNFIEKTDKFSEEVIDGLFKNLDKKIEHPHVKLQVQDAETIERETKKENDEFANLYKKFNEVNDAAT